MMRFRNLGFVAMMTLHAAGAHGQATQEIASQLFTDILTDPRATSDPLYKRRLVSAIVEEWPDSALAQSILSGQISFAGLPGDPAWHRMLVAGGTISGYRHGQYPSLGQKTHPGFDVGLPGDQDCGLPVTAPKTGSVIRVVSADVTDSDLLVMGVDRSRNDRDLSQNTGNAIVLRHDEGGSVEYSIYLHFQGTPTNAEGSPWKPGMTIAAGELVGLIGNTGNAQGCHLHFEARRFEGTYRYLHPTYGNIYPAGDVSAQDDFLNDWIDPEAFLRSAFIAQHLAARGDYSAPGTIQNVSGLTEPLVPGAHANSTTPGVTAVPLGSSSLDSSAVVASGDWGPGLVAGVDVGFMPCGGTAVHTPTCLYELGLSHEAAAFSFAVDGDYSGSSVGKSFNEVGAVDLAVSQFIGNTVYYTPVLINGPAGLHLVQSTLDLGLTFKDDASREMLRRFPNATSIGVTEVTSHRLLADGTQRFTVVETIADACRACPVLGVGTSFIDIGPSTGGSLVRRPAGLLLDGSGSAGGMTPNVLRTGPEILQARLNALGYDAGPMDGYPGPQTRQAVMEFQVEHCLTPTGQPDRATSDALIATNGFDAPCANGQLPAGISSNRPLLDGIYVDDPALCSVTNVPFETVHLQQRIINNGHMTWGLEGGCDVRRTDIRNGVTLFRGACFEGGQSNVGSWHLDIISNEEFIDLDMLTAIPTDAAPRHFSRCPDSSTLRREYSAWFN